MTRGRVFYGWWVTIAFAVMVFLPSGVRFSVGPFLKPIVADLVSLTIDEAARGVPRLRPVAAER